MNVTRRITTAVLAAAAAAGSASCHDGLLYRAAGDRPGMVAVRALMNKASAGGAADAFGKADRIFLRFRAGDEVRAEQEVPFSSTATQTVVRADVPLRALQEPISAEFELRIGNRPLFRGTATATLTSGVVTPVEVVPDPVVASVICGTGTVQLSAYGQTAQVSGAPLFATGDTVPNVPVTWAIDASSVASVTDAGQITALADGDATVRCSAADASATRAVRVFANVSSIQLNPPSATLVLGNSLPYVAILLDSRGNAITTPRTVSWTTGSSSIASVNSSGVVTGVAFGTTRVDATSGTVVGSATVQVVSPSSAVTIAATGITGIGATLRGSVNPNGTATQASFEWGTDANLANPNATLPRAVGSGTTDVNLSEAITNLTPGTTYFFRVVSSSAGGTVRGTTLSFTTPRLPAATTVDLDPSNTTSYVVRGTVTPNGSPTQGRFDYGTSPTLAGAQQTGQQSVGSGTQPVAISQTLSGLQPSTTYYFRTVATNVGGTAAGSILSFRTGSAPSIGAASGTAPTGNCQVGASVSASASPGGLSTQAWFEYGTSSNLATFTSTAPQGIGAGTAFVGFSSTIILSSSGGTYFRAAASNPFGVSRGGIQGPLFAPLCVR